ncbi:hypothetical protein FGO68_gene8630 [Halteria grandinella]|uniref:Uncharacterized protein n=1 Tax=Halteria grandinella TaxID=5974 RepID=A0A8J8T6Y1_HALGN|nr:hypothetical protein FGO68_gene8630 [Halteria grandinella]
MEGSFLLLGKVCEGCGFQGCSTAQGFVGTSQSSSEDELPQPFSNYYSSIYNIIQNGQQTRLRPACQPL